MTRREYVVSLTINGVKISKAIIDSHYELRHADSISDDLILRLLQLLDGQEFEPEQEIDEYQYFVSDRLEFEGKYYKLIWLLEENQIYIGIINAYRR